MFDHKNLLSIDELSAEDIMTVLTYAKTFEEVNERPIKKAFDWRQDHLQFVPRTFNAYARIVRFCGVAGPSCDTINAGGSASSTVKGESLVDTVKTLDSMKVDMFVVRHKYAGTPYMVSQHTNAAVIDAGDGKHQHPTQALLDLYTIWKEKGLPEGPCGYRGRYRAPRGRSACSCTWGLGAEVYLIAPATMLPAAPEALGVARVYANLDEALPELDVVYMLRIQMERLEEAPFPSLREYNLLYGLTKEREELMKPDAIICHPGPINRGAELDSYMADGSRSVITDQVFSGVCVRMALIYLLLGRANDGLSA